MVMGLLAGVAAPRMVHSLHTTRANAAANRMVADLNFARSRAMLKGDAQRQVVRFYPASEEYHLVDIPDPDRSDREYWVRFEQSQYPVDIVSCRFTNEEDDASTMTIEFDRHGRPWAGNDPDAPVTEGYVELQSGSVERTVVIDPVTGKASVQ